MTSKNHPVAMITGGTRGIGSGIYSLSFVYFSLTIIKTTFWVSTFS